MASLAALDDPVSFKTLLQDCQMPQPQMDHIVQLGFTTVALLAHGLHEESQMEEFVEFLSLIPEGEKFQTFSPQSASIRRVLKESISRCVQQGRDMASEPSPSVAAKPKLSMVEVKAMRAEFCQNYPGELLTPSTTPSLALLSSLKDMIDSNSLTWVAWKSRTSELDEQLFLEHRRPRNDRQLLRSLLTEGDAALIDHPEADVNHQAPVEVVVSKFQHLLAVALAMLGAAHLLVLKRFNAKFLDLAVMKPRDPHLRPPTLAEILDADRAAWGAVSEILSESRWSLNDVLNEVAFCRQVFHTSLAPRPKPIQPLKADPPKRKPELPKPDPKKPKPGAPKQPPKTDATKKNKWDQSWAKKLPNGTGICIRYHLGSCRASKTCRYAHQCPIPKSNGEPCAGFHMASQHVAAPH